MNRNSNLLNIFDIGGTKIIGQLFPLSRRSPFLWADILAANFSSSGNEEVAMWLLMTLIKYGKLWLEDILSTLNEIVFLSCILNS